MTFILRRDINELHISQVAFLIFYRHVIYMYVNYEVKYTYTKDTTVGGR
jgi:hypothetical protein